MSGRTALRMVEAATPVNIAMVDDATYLNPTLEPSMVRIRASNSSKILTTSLDTNQPGRPPADCTVSSSDGAILLQRIKRISLSSIAIHDSTPVINESNNVILCYDVATNSVYTFNIAIGDYVTPQQLITAFQAAKTASGLATQFQYTFRGATPPAYLAGKGPRTDSEVLLVTSSPVLFLPQSTGVKYGGSTFGFTQLNKNIPAWNGINPVQPIQQLQYTFFAATEQMIGPMKCCYTQYIDVFSRTLTKWAKVTDTATSNAVNNLLHRIYYPDFDGYPTDPGVILINDDRVPAQVATAIVYLKPTHEIISIPSVNTYITVYPQQSITTIDFSFLDEYGRTFVTSPLLYSVTTGAVISARVATDTTDKPVNEALGTFTGGLSWNINLYAEL